MRSVMIYVILLFLPLAVIAKPIQLTHETSDELLIEFTLPEWEFEQKTERNANWHKIQTDFGTIRNQEGYPEVYTFSEAIGIPVDGDISFQILDMKTTTHKEINLLPIRRMLVTRDAVDYEFYQNNLAYQNENFYPQNPVEKGEAAFIGDRRFVSFRINPFRYKAAARELQVIKSLKLRIVISGNKASAKNWQLAENPIDAAADEFFLNNNTSKTWRMEKVRDHSYSAPKNGSGQIHEIQLIVDKEGIYKVTKGFLQGHIASQQALLGQNLAWSLNSIDPRNLELRDKNGQVPIHFVGESDGSFDDGDYFEFYGDRNYGKSGYSDAYTAENVYTLSLNAGLGARMAVENGGLINSNPAQYKMPTAYEYTTHLEEQLIIDKLGRGWSAQNLNFYKEDIWFWRKISAPNLDIVPFNLEYPKDSAINHFQAKIALYGLTYSDPVPPSGQYDHSAEVRLNQAMINMHSWVGQTEKIFENANPMPNSYLRHGENHLYISLPGNTVMGDREQVLLDYATITYWREYKTSTDDILFAKPPLSSQYPYGLYQFEVSGFSDSNVSLYKIGSSVFNSMQIEPFNLEGTAPWTVTFQDSVASADVKYYAVTEAKKMQPKQVRLNIVSDLQNPSNAADVILVTVREFVECNATQQLVDLWEARGYTLKVVDVQDIYDEFNNGIRAAEPIRDFFRYAYNNWSNPQLKHVILMGEGTDDERDFSTNRPYNLIPVKKLWTFKHGATASDNWYACIVGNDFVADVSVARINIWAETQIENFAQKVAQYNNNPLPNRLWSSHITLASGGKITDTDDKFAQQSERIRRKAIPNHYRVSRVYTSTQTVSPDYFGGTFSLKDAINSGSQFVQFMGHGGGRIWADYNLFNFTDVATLNNQAFPFVMSLACYCSAFDTRGAASISEALINQANKGSIATLGFTGLGYEYDDEDYGLALNEALFKHDFDSLGEAIIFTKARFFTTCASVAATPALINGSAFLGDPLAKLRKPVAGIPVSVEKNVLQPGDTLRVTGQFPAGVTAARLFVMKTNEKVVNVPYDLPVVQNTFNASYVIPADQGTNYTRKLYVAGYSQDTEYIGMGQVGIGLANVMHHALNPVKPTWADSVSFSARVYLQNPVNSLICRVRVDTLLT
ncbi:MAG: C25 family cysteine peptidase, partial [Candidatus Cloacimonetes bacterium]|nr:C25 family cysteine peptidase [Candidatus Cloacimonadota bacterium]